MESGRIRENLGFITVQSSRVRLGVQYWTYSSTAEQQQEQTYWTYSSAAEQQQEQTLI